MGGGGTPREVPPVHGTYLPPPLEHLLHGGRYAFCVQAGGFSCDLVCFCRSVDVIAIAAGPQHVVAVGSESEVFAWGRGDGGRLGLGNDED